MSSPQNTLEAKIPYFYSQSHILGCVFAMLGLILHFLTKTESLPWYAAALFFYGIGSSIFKDKPKYVAKPLIQQTTPKEVSLRIAMNKIILKNKRFLPDDAIDLLISIGYTIESILPKLESNPYMLMEAHTVRKIIEDYLPVTLACYIKIPSEYANNDRLEDKTAHQMLIEQLTLLNYYLNEIFKNLVDEDVKALIINGRFLKEKFAPTDDGFGI